MRVEVGGGGRKRWLVRLRPAQRGVAMADCPERGDVPGWVLVTLMTAGLVAALWGVASDRLQEVFERALSSVGGG